MLKDAARFMSSELSIPMQPAEDQDLPELSRKVGITKPPLSTHPLPGVDPSLRDHSSMRKEVPCLRDEGLAVSQETLLGGALQFLAEIGEDISVSIPDRQLHDGDFIEIEGQVRETPQLIEGGEGYWPFIT